MTSPTEKLRAASILIDEVLGTLNTRTVQCDAGHTHAVDPIEAKAHEALVRYRDGVLAWADTLYLPRDQRRNSIGARHARLARRRR